MWCATRAASSLPADNLETVYGYTRDVLVELTRTLLGLFAENTVRATTESAHVENVLRQLLSLDDACIEECVPEDLVPDILHLAKTLETSTDYTEHYYVQYLQMWARELKENIIRVKRKPGAT